jgi:hypothetical protein
MADPSLLIPLEQLEPLPEVSPEGQALLDDLDAFLRSVADESPDIPDTVFGLVLGGEIQPCGKAYWRGVLVCDHMVPRLNAWAKAVGDDIYLRPLPGCGSYQTSTAASAGTHARGGAIDIDTRGMTWEQRRRIHDVGRRWFEVDWQRDAISGLWTWHNHAIDPSCPNLSRQAMAQVVLYRDGKNGLANNGPDFGTRLYVADAWTRYQRRAYTTVATVAADILSIAGEAIDAVEEDDMPLNDADKSWIEAAVARKAKAEIEAYFKSTQSNVDIFQTHKVFKNLGAANPDTAARISASAVMENGMLDRRIDRTGDADKSAIQEIADTLTLLRTQNQSVSTIEGKTHEQDDLLRTVLGKLDELLGKAAGA